MDNGFTENRVFQKINYGLFGDFLESKIPFNRSREISHVFTRTKKRIIQDLFPIIPDFRLFFPDFHVILRAL
jgi:hypothetical protein